MSSEHMREILNLQDEEMKKLFSMLSPRYRIELISVARKFAGIEKNEKYVQEILKYYRQLNAEGRKEARKILFELFLDPRYHK